MDFLKMQANILQLRRTSPKLPDRPAPLNLNPIHRSRTMRKITAWTQESKLFLN
jgi:hypothetical protein